MLHLLWQSISCKEAIALWVKRGLYVLKGSCLSLTQLVGLWLQGYIKYSSTDVYEYQCMIRCAYMQAPFDASSVMSAKRLSDSVRVPGHIYPTALLCFNIMPPPHQV
jgi:hypothetical protein